MNLVLVEVVRNTNNVTEKLINGSVYFTEYFNYRFGKSC